jgi:hypothetical protein
MAAGCNMGSTPEACQADCESTREKYQACLSETDALFACAANGAYVCAPGVTTIAGCDAEKNALSVCGACIPVGSDSPCDICAKQSCCSEYKALGTAPDLTAYQSCLQGCSTQDCLTACEQSSPVAAQAFHAADDCRNAQCPSACGGIPSTVDPVGRYCAALAKAGCPIDNCEQSFGKVTAPGDCGVEYYDALDCASKNPIDCQGQSENDPCIAEWTACMGLGGSGTGGGGVVGGAGGAGGSVVGGAGGSVIGGAGGGVLGGTGGA